MSLRSRSSTPAPLDDHPDAEALCARIRPPPLHRQYVQEVRLAPQSAERAAASQDEWQVSHRRGARVRLLRVVAQLEAHRL